jgi:glucose-induced degradation protein 8
VELIRECNNSSDRDISVALKFAQTKLGPQATMKPEFLEDLEKTMSLLVFPQDDNLDPSLAALLQPSLRRDVADQVNQAILEYQQQRKESGVKKSHVRRVKKICLKLSSLALMAMMPIDMMLLRTATSQ